MLEIKPSFVATGIGSLPYSDSRKAIEIISKTFPEMPHWPQLPKSLKGRGRLKTYLFFCVI